MQRTRYWVSSSRLGLKIKFFFGGMIFAISGKQLDVAFAAFVSGAGLAWHLAFPRFSGTDSLPVSCSGPALCPGLHLPNDEQFTSETNSADNRAHFPIQFERKRRVCRTVFMVLLAQTVSKAVQLCFRSHSDKEHYSKPPFQTTAHTLAHKGDAKGY